MIRFGNLACRLYWRLKGKPVLSYEDHVDGMVIRWRYLKPWENRRKLVKVTNLRRDV